MMMMLEGRRSGRITNSQFFADGFHLDGVIISRSRDQMGGCGFRTTTLVSSSMPPRSCSVSSSASSSSSSSSSSSPGGVEYIEHCVSKMDTIAGVAIKYGVDVADIKRLNGLVTDLHMYALKSLQIPLAAGRHRPSRFASDDHPVFDSSRHQTPPKRVHNGVYDLVRLLDLRPPPSEVVPSAAMNSLREDHHGLMHTPRSGLFNAYHYKED